MGNFLKISTVSTIGLSISSNLTENMMNEAHEIDIEGLDNIEIKSSLLKFLPFGTHSYAIGKTYTGRKVRFDYTSDKGGCVIYDYYEYFFAEVLKSGKIIPGISVKKAVKIFKKHSDKEKYSVIGHNCHTVINDFFNEVTGNDEVNLACELKEIIREKLKQKKKNSELNDILLYGDHKYFCRTMKESLKQGKTKEFIREVLSQFRNNQIKLVEVYQKIIDGFQEEFDENEGLALKKQYEIGDELLGIRFNLYKKDYSAFEELYEHYRRNEKILNKLWIEK